MESRKPVLAISDELAVSVGIAWRHRTDAGRARWQVRVNRDPRSNLTLVVRMDESNASIRENKPTRAVISVTHCDFIFVYQSPA